MTVEYCIYRKEASQKISIFVLKVGMAHLGLFCQFFVIHSVLIIQPVSIAGLLPLRKLFPSGANTSYITANYLGKAVIKFCFRTE